MADTSEEKYRNLVYLMLTKYHDRWEDSFPSDMGIPPDVCRRMYSKYRDEVLEIIEKDKELTDDRIPSADDIIRKGMIQLEKRISSCDDPSRIARSIQLLDELKNGNSVKKEVKKSIFDKLNAQ